MRNLKHTIIAIAAIVMIGTLSVFQLSDISAKKIDLDMKLAAANRIENITIAVTENEAGTRGLALKTSEEDAVEASKPIDTVDEETEQEIAEKSYLTLGYAKVTGSADLKETPSEEAQTIGTMNGAEQIEILESTDGWYKVMADGVSGYIKDDFVTQDKAEATEAAMKYDHYKKTKVSSDSGLTVRRSASEDSESVDTISDDEDIIVVDAVGDYLKILYGSDYAEGYVINSGVSKDGEWVEKDDVHAEIIRIAEEKKEAARREAIAKENAKNVSSGYSVSESSASVSSSGSGGQAIVNTAMNYLGVPYVWGGTSPSGFDCSGLVQYVCSKNGISVPRVASSQRGAGTYVSRENLQPGDLVFFSNGGDVSHVGIYVGNGNMIHAPQTGDVVKISSIETSYRISHYAGAVRVW